MKKILSLCLVLCLVIGMITACAKEPAKSAEDTAQGVLPLKTGILSRSAVSEEESEKLIGEHTAAHHTGPMKFELTYYDNMSSMLMALQAKDIYVMILADSVAEYIVAQNDSLMIAAEIQGDGLNQNTASYQMMMKEDATDIHQKFNDAILELKEEGVIDELIETHIKGHTDGSNSQPVEIPVTDGADTIKVAVTGDLPPLDFVAADGTPAGFNMALLAEIAKKANVNIEVVQVDTGARAAALTSGRADVVFWVNTNSCTVHGDIEKGSDIPEGTIVTEPYFTEPISFVTFKQ
ncbi:MAG: transporter substrate-binding domain-containing protein [Lachnospiraceae bacterium]|nr:transporter substrate-binding domain-containing protein [Lachnospiraceae bacterium]